jgi:hypothetical protein
MNIKFNVKTNIRFNGQEYAGVEAMPPDVRRVYEQALAKAQVRTSTKVVFNGQTYASLAEMPPDLRSQYDQVMAMLDKNHDGIPDMLQTSGTAASDGSMLVEVAPLVSKSVTAPESRGRGLPMILVGVLVLVVVVVFIILIKGGLH